MWAGLGVEFHVVSIYCGRDVGIPWILNHADNVYCVYVWLRYAIKGELDDSNHGKSAELIYPV